MMQQLIDPFERCVTEDKIQEARRAIDQAGLSPDEEDAEHRKLDRLIVVTGQPGSD